MPPPASSRLLPVLTFLAAQAALWLVLALAFATLLVVTGSLSWVDAFGISSLNWLPWVALAPGVFWLSLRFPLVRGHLLSSVPLHVAACVVCVGLALGLALETGPELMFGGGPPGGRGMVRPDGFAGRGRGPMNDNQFRRDQFPGGRGEFRRMEPGFSRDGGRDGRGGFGRGEPGMFPPPGGFPRDGFGPGGMSPGSSTGGPTSTGRRDSLGRRGPPGDFFPPLGLLLLRANFDLAVYFIVAAAAHALAFYRRAQERDRHALELTATLNRAKLDALRLQLQPHFLFNTLNAIATLVHRDARAADELIGDLSDLLRLSLVTTDHEVPLAREIELLDRYLAIEQTRLGDRLRVAREIDATATGALVPAFVLQPLAENAVRHGLEPRSSPGTLTISARRDGETLHLAVADDGVGLAVDQLVTRRGIGLANTEARLQALHGAAAKLELRTPPEGGLRVEITLPFRTAPQPAPQPEATAQKS